MEEISKEQLEANIKNAHKSTGPKTEEGKAVSKYNAVKHGLLCKQILFEGEDAEELLNLEKRLRAEFLPMTEIEFLLVDKVASIIWRLKRVLSIEEDGVFALGFIGKKLYIVENSDRFFRYETMLERSLYKALHELERIQSKRNGEKVPPPLALDVNISDDKVNGFV